VAQYVECALLLLVREEGFRRGKPADANERFCLKGATIGIVGCGHVGSKVKAVAERLGMRVLICDPPLEEAFEQFPSPIVQHQVFVPLSTIEQEADVITFHVPLTTEGHFATWHMADEAFFHRLARVPYIINTSRGEVVDNDALLRALEEGRVRDAVVDVWEHEPDLNRRLLEKVFIGTPHIAGYSADGKANADNMVVDAICHQFHLPRPALIVPPSLPEDFVYSGDALELYNPLVDSQRLKKCPEDFEKLRNNYPLRREQYDK
jgi:erythronate-4-phosphate dehydrogenase